MTAELQQTPPAVNTPVLSEGASAFSMAPVELPRYQLLDAFRGIAILWIVAFHLLEGVREQYGEVLSYIIGRGALGVQIFLVIGGYGIAVSTLGGAYNGAPVSFIARRLKRIYPPYWWHLLFAVLLLPLCCAVLSRLKSGTFQWNIPSHTAMEWLQIATLTRVFAATNWQLNLPFVAVNGVVWYIAVVVQIYLFVGLCLCFKSHFFSLMVVSCGASLVANFSPIKGVLPYGIFLPYFHEFAIGLFVYYLLRRNLVPKWPWASMLLVLVSLGAVGCCVAYYSPMVRLSFAVFVGVLFLVLYPYDARACRLLPIRVLCLVGVFSYSLYLMHVPLFPFVGMVIRNVVTLPSSVSIPTLAIPGIVVLSFVWYLYFERPSTPGAVFKSLGTPFATLRAGVRNATIAVGGSNANWPEANSRV